MTTMAVKDLDDSFAIMYRGTIYKIDKITTEATLRNLKLVSLDLKNIVTVLWHPNSIVTCSPFLSKRCLITKDNGNNKFEIEGVTKPLELTLPYEYSIKIRQWITLGRKVCIVLCYCFNDLHFGNIYSFN